jgi:hypothetical protein
MNTFNLFSYRQHFIKLLSLVFAFSLIFSACEEDQSEEDKDSFESNNTWQEASSVSLDETYNAEISTESDVDFYTYTTNHSASTYDVVSIQFTNVGQDMKVCVEILDGNGQSLATAESSTAGANWTYNVTCPGGTYILKVHGNDGFTTFTGKYSFTISNQSVNDDYAPNHSIETAAEVNLSTDLNGEIVSYDEEDYFVFSNANTSYWQQFELAFTNVSSELMVHYEILDSDKNTITDGSGDKGANVSWKFPTKSGQIYVKVWGYDYYGDTKGSYTANLSVTDANDNNEPDDTFADARVINSYPTGDISGKVVAEAANDNGGDYEFYKVTVKAGKKVEFSVDPQASNTEMHFGIYNEDESYTGNGLDGTDGQTLNYSLNNSSSSDVIVYIKLGAFPGDNGDYTISFTETTAS